MPHSPDQSQPDSDAALIRRAAGGGGDPDAFRTLYLRHRDFVFRIARRFSATDDDALDAAQDTFIYLLRKLPTLRLSGKLSTYLYPIVKNSALARIRSQARLHTSEAIAPRPTASTPFPANERDAALAAALATLSDDLREVLLMRLVEEMTVDEVATALDIPAGTVKSRLHNALAALRNSPALQDLHEDREKRSGE